MSYKCFIVGALLCAIDGWSLAYAQHSDVLIQDVDDRLHSGTADFDSGNWIIGARSFAGEFDSDFAVNDPGWNALGVGSPAMPAGAEALPANTDLEWDFLPMMIDGTAANLFYWNGTGDVQFGTLPAANYELSMQSKSAGFIGVDGSAALLPGEVIDDTDSIGSLHRHRFFFLDDGDGNLGTDPADGIYLFTIRTRVINLDRSAPIFFLFGTPGSTSTALTDAQQWVDSGPDDLAPDFSADFNGDLGVDGSDLGFWQQGFGTSGNTALQINGDANFNTVINGADFFEWQLQFGSDMATFSGANSPPQTGTASVPEPRSIYLLVAVVFPLWYPRRHKFFAAISR